MASVPRILFLVAAVQFINITDFMMVMPLGPDFARALDIPSSHIGYLGGAYTLAAAVSGVIGAFVLDRFDRRTALALSMAGLMAGTLFGAFATGMSSLLLARVIAGAFGGPASSISLAIVADAVPPEQRGRAMGVVMGAFSAAAVLGVPLGIELARHASWKAPFVLVAVMGLFITFASWWMLPPMRAHLGATRAVVSPLAQLRDPLSLLALSTIFLIAFSAFLVIPNFSAYFQFNAGYPRERLGLLYLAGGAVSFFAMRGVGFLVDKIGAAAVATAGTLGFAALVYRGVPLIVPPMLFFVLFMIFQPSRAVPSNAMGTRVSPPESRASFQSLASSTTHLACALGAMLSANVLRERADHALERFDQVGALSVAVAALLPPLMFVVERGVRRRERERREPAGEELPPVSVH